MLRRLTLACLALLPAASPARGDVIGCELSAEIEAPNVRLSLTILGGASGWWAGPGPTDVVRTAGGREQTASIGWPNSCWSEGEVAPDAGLPRVRCDAGDYVDENAPAGRVQYRISDEACAASPPEDLAVEVWVPAGAGIDPDDPWDRSAAGDPSDPDASDDGRSGGWGAGDGCAVGAGRLGVNGLRVPLLAAFLSLAWLALRTDRRRR